MNRQSIVGRAVRAHFSAAAIFFFLSASTGQAAVFDAFDDFSSTNPSGVWSYLYWFPNSLFSNPNLPALSDYSSNLVPIEFYAPLGTCLAGTECWTNAFVDIRRNPTASPADFGVVVTESGTLSLSAAGLVAVRFTAPADGSYSIEAFFDGDSKLPSETRNLIALNGDASNALFDKTAVRAFGERDELSFQPVQLSVGDTIDFMLAETFFDVTFGDVATGFGATVREVPEPTSAMGLAIGCAAFGLVRRRRRRSQ